MALFSIIALSMLVCVFIDITLNNITSIPALYKCMQHHNTYSTFIFAEVAVYTDKHGWGLCFCPCWHKHWKQSFWISLPWKEFPKSSIFSDLKQHLCVYKRPIDIEKAFFFKEITLHVDRALNVWHNFVWQVLILWISLNASFPMRPSPFSTWNFLMHTEVCLYHRECKTLLWSTTTALLKEEKLSVQSSSPCSPLTHIIVM